MSAVDLAIRGANVLDGSGEPAFEADVGIADGRIARVGSVGDARREIDAEGLTLAPGFVDTHTHDDGALLRHPGMEFKLAQGVTSVVIGNCGFSAAPNRSAGDAAPGSSGLFPGLSVDWTDLAGYFATVASARPAVNAVALVGHNTMRALALGDASRAPTGAELAQMRGWLEAALEQGACGFSTGLIYRPGRYSTTEEVIAIAAPLRERGGIYATHMRDEADGLLDAVEETLRIGREVGCAVQISHHKAAGPRNWGRVRDSLARIDRANAEGADVTLDVYPYTAGSGPLAEYVSIDHIAPAFAKVVAIASCPAFPEYEGRRVPEIAETLGVAPEEVVRRILTAPRGELTICIHFIIDEADIETNLRHPRMMIGSDGIPDLRGKPHPRLFGTFPRVLAEYVRARGILTLEEAVRRMTSLACERFGLAQRGRVAEGYWADLVLFDPAAIRDTASYEDPKREPVGIALVVVNGQVACRDGRHTRVGSGRPLRYRVDARTGALDR
ncbi:MAG: D-aminoacylase [Deltaproteobacteria bacterium]|nr:MAG: D-aminoacylase [Deltaproteobacteria bacterium]